MSLSRSDSALEAFHRRLCARMDKSSANIIVAHKLARMAWFMLTRAEAFVNQEQQSYEEQLASSVAALKRRVKTMGFEVIPLLAGVVMRFLVRVL